MPPSCLSLPLRITPFLPKLGGVDFYEQPLVEPQLRHL